MVIKQQSLFYWYSSFSMSNEQKQSQGSLYAPSQVLETKWHACNDDEDDDNDNKSHE